jgi:hypothetical protein
MKIENFRERREKRRILAVCKILDINRQFLGFTLDLTTEGICLVVLNQFGNDQQFEIIIQQNRNDGEHPEIRATVETIWRREKNEEYDEIGGKIVVVDSQENLKALIEHCDRDAQEKNNFQLSITNPG